MKFLLALLPVVGAVQTNLCYRINYDWDVDTSVYRKNELVYPVRSFPANHAMVTNGYCGGATAGDPIPTGTATCDNCLFGSLKQTAEECIAAVGNNLECVTPPFDGCAGRGRVNGGSMFYAYDQPKGSSSNTGYQEAEMSDVYFVQDDSNNIFLVLNHDKPGTGSGGQARLEITSTGLGTNTYVAQKDDTSGADYFGVGEADKCKNTNTDCFAWDESIGEGSFAWTWQTCCTDGMVLGPMPYDNFELVLNYTQVRGINEFRFGSYIEAMNNVSFVRHAQNTTDGLWWATPSTQFMVEGYTCDDYCQVLVDEALEGMAGVTLSDQCDECGNSEACGWCPNSQGGYCRGRGDCAQPITTDCSGVLAPGTTAEPTPPPSPTAGAPTRFPTPPPQTLAPLPGTTPEPTEANSGTTSEPTAANSGTTSEPTDAPPPATTPTRDPTDGAAGTTSEPTDATTPTPPPTIVTPQPTTSAVVDTATETTVVDGTTTTTTTTATDGSTSTAVTTVDPTDPTTTTTTTTAADGTESTAVTTVNTDGSLTTTTTAADGSVSTAVTTADPADPTTTTTVTTNADGSTSTSAVTTTPNGDGSSSVSTTTTTTAATADPTAAEAEPTATDADPADVSGVSSAAASVSAVLATVATVAMTL